MSKKTYEVSFTPALIAETTIEVMKKDGRVASTILTHMLPRIFRGLVALDGGVLRDTRSGKKVLVRTTRLRGSVSLLPSFMQGHGRSYDADQFLDYFTNEVAYVMFCDVSELPKVRITHLLPEDIIDLEATSLNKVEQGVLFSYASDLIEIN